MSITKKVVGCTKNGETVTLYTMRNKNGVEASVTDLGAVWTGLRAPDREGRFEDVLLGYDTPDALYENKGSLGAIIGRNANRIKNAEFSLNGKQWQLEKNSGENNLHSGPAVLGKRLFSAEEGSVEQADWVRFSLHSPEGDQGYPGSMDICITYFLTVDNALIIEYKLTAGKEDTVANFTCHPYFNLAGHKSGNALSQELWIDADYFCEANKDVTPTGRLLRVENTPFDFRSPKAMNRDLDLKLPQLQYTNGYDHNFCLNHPMGRMALSASAYDPESGRFMEVYTGRPGIQLYTGNFLDPGVEAKEGAHYHPGDGYALETQLFPNAINVPEWDQPILEAGRTTYCLTTYKFSVK